MSHVKGNIRGAQHVRNGKLGKQVRQQSSWDRCKQHKFTDKDRCKSCGAPKETK